MLRARPLDPPLITKAELVKHMIRRVGKHNGPHSNFGKEFNLFIIVLFSFVTTHGMIFLIGVCRTPVFSTRPVFRNLPVEQYESLYDVIVSHVMM